MEEQAYIEEWAYAVMNMVAAEEHLIESFFKTSNREFLEMADVQRSLRQIFVSTLYDEPEKTINTMKEILSRESAILMNLIQRFKESKNNLDEGGERTSQGEIWCTIKHLMSIKMHIIECLQKKIREVNK